MGKSGEQIVMGILSYLGILFLIPLLVKKDDRWVQMHAKQGLALFLLWIIVWIVAMVLWMVPFLSTVLYILLLVLWLVEIIKVAQGQDPYIVPIFGPMVQKWKL